MYLRKASPGSDSYGNVWKTANSVVEVSDEQGADLLAIKDAGFAVVNKAADHDDEHDDEQEDEQDVAEVDPDGHGDASPAPRRPRSAGRRRSSDSE